MSYSGESLTWTSKWSDNTSAKNTNDWSIGTLTVDFDNSIKEMSEINVGSTMAPPKNKHREDQPMENLYNVIVVSKDREILMDEKVVAADEDEARFAVDVHGCIKAKGLKPKDVTVLVKDLGEVKVRKEVQKVRIVEKEEK